MAKQPKPYIAPHAVYTGGVFYQPGEVFVTDAKPGEQWETVTGAEKAAIEAADDKYDDVDLNKLDVSGLKAHAASLGVNVGEAKTKPELIQVITAWNDPTR